MRKRDVAIEFHGAAIHLLRALSRQDAGMGLTPARASVLSILVFAGPRTLKQLTEAERVAPATMTKLVAGLERDGLTHRKALPSDARSWVIHATPQARRLLQRGRMQRVRLLLRLLKDAQPADWRALKRAAHIVEASLRNAPRN